MTEHRYYFSKVKQLEEGADSPHSTEKQRARLEKNKRKADAAQKALHSKTVELSRELRMLQDDVRERKFLRGEYGRLQTAQRGFFEGCEAATAGSGAAAGAMPSAVQRAARASASRQ